MPRVKREQAREDVQAVSRRERQDDVPENLVADNTRQCRISFCLDVSYPDHGKIYWKTYQLDICIKVAHEHSLAANSIYTVSRAKPIMETVYPHFDLRCHSAIARELAKFEHLPGRPIPERQDEAPYKKRDVDVLQRDIDIMPSFSKGVERVGQDHLLRFRDTSCYFGRES